jgi:hypothetical protein
MDRVVYGATDFKRGFNALGTNLHPKTKISKGIEEEICADLLSDFFRKKKNQIIYRNHLAQILNFQYKCVLVTFMCLG